MNGNEQIIGEVIRGLLQIVLVIAQGVGGFLLKQLFGTIADLRADVVKLSGDVVKLREEVAYQRGVASSQGGSNHGGS